MFVYKAEREAGLSELLKAPQSVLLSASLRAGEPFPAKSRAEHAQASTADDLHFLAALLVTAGWGMSDRGVPYGFNLNDDFFDPLEAFAARRTPEDKPTNLEHDSGQIVGHITSNVAVDDDLKEIADIDADDPPEKFHVKVRAALYKVWSRKELQERADKLVAELASPSPGWSVSMECLFRGFDYVVVEGGVAKAVARDKATAYLTKHLRAYGGKGSYEGVRVGRLLRNISFSGMALVRNPANPESVVLAKTLAKTLAPEDAAAKPLPPKKEVFPPVYSPSTQTQESSMNETEKKLAEALAAIKAVEAERDQYKAKASEHDAKAHDKAIAEAKAREDGLKKSLEEASAQVKSLEATLASEKDSREKAEKALAEANESAKKVAEELGQIRADAKKAERLAKVRAARQVADGDEEGAKSAAKLAETLSKLDDAEFDAALAEMKFTPAQTPPQSTPAPKPTQSTDKPAPNRASAAADAADALEQSQKVADAATSVTDPDAEKLRVNLKAKVGQRLFGK